jgi:histidinol-phosphate aminotransferase
VLDEAYFEYGRLRGTQDAVVWLAEHPNLVILRTFSKAYGLAGARVGYAISHPEVAAVLNRLRPAFNVNSLAQAGALAALADQAHMRTAVRQTMSELTRVETELRRLGLWTAPSAGNFLLLRLDAPAAPVYERLLRCGLIVRPLAGYGLANCLRISIGLPADNDRLLATLPQALAAGTAPAL